MKKIRIKTKDISKKIVIVLILVVAVLTGGSSLIWKLKFSKMQAAAKSQVDFPIYTDYMKNNWVVSTVPSTSLKFAYRPIFNTTDLRLSVQSNGPNTVSVNPEINNIKSLFKKSVDDLNSLGEYCDYPGFSITVTKPDSNIKTLREYISQQMKGSGQTFVYDYASEYGLFSSINGKEIFAYNFTEDRSFHYGAVFTKNGIAEIYMDDKSPCNYIEGGSAQIKSDIKDLNGVYSNSIEFSFIDVLKGIAFNN